jgi:replication factor A1
MSVVSKNAIQSMRTNMKKEGLCYTVQVIDIKLIGSSRYRAIISDGDYFDQSFIGGPSHHYFSNGMVQLYQLIKIKDYSITDINSAFIITLNEIEPGTVLKSVNGSPVKYEPKPKLYDQKQSKPIAVGKENLEFTSAKTLTSSSKDFVIKARITKKSDMKEWKNERGTGKLFSVNIIDSFNEEISVTFFKEEAEKFYGMIEEGKVYIFKNGQVKISNKKFQSIDSEYSITVDKRTEIIMTTDDSDISAIKFNPVTIESISNMPVGTLVDICAAIIDAGEITEIMSKKTNKMMKKRTVRLIDQSNAIIELTLWNEDATQNIFEYPHMPIIFIGKSLKTSNFNGASLSTDRNCTQVIYNSDLPQTKLLKNWLSRTKDHSNARVLSIRPSIGYSDKTYKSFYEIKQDAESTDCKENSYLVNGIIVFIRKDDPSYMFYSACKNKNKCKKKLVKDSDGYYRCEGCQETFNQCEFNYILSIKLQDFADCLWVTAFDEVANTLLGHSATTLHAAFIDNIELFEDIITRSYMKRIEGVVKSKIKETPQGKRPQYVLNSVKFADPLKSMNRNLSIISDYFNN